MARPVWPIFRPSRSSGRHRIPLRKGPHKPPHCPTVTYQLGQPDRYHPPLAFFPRASSPLLCFLPLPRCLLFTSSHFTPAPSLLLLAFADKRRDPPWAASLAASGGPRSPAAGGSGPRPAALGPRRGFPRRRSLWMGRLFPPPRRSWRRSSSWGIRLTTCA